MMVCLINKADGVTANASRDKQRLLDYLGLFV